MAFLEKHKKSASYEWLQHRARIMEYQCPIVIRDEAYQLVAMKNGKHSDPDGILLIRHVTHEQAIDIINASGWWYGKGIARCDEEGNHLVFYYAYSFSRYAYTWSTPEDSDTDLDINFRNYYINSLCAMKGTTRKEVERMCHCSGRCYCEPALEYEVREHSNSVVLSKGRQQINVTVEELTGLMGFLAGAKQEIKRLKLESIATQIEDLEKQKKQAEEL
jgi:hypothetical protein